MPRNVTIRVAPDTKRRFRRFGQKRQTDEQILKSLIDRAEFEDYAEEQYRRLRDKSDFIPLDEL